MPNLQGSIAKLLQCWSCEYPPISRVVQRQRKKSLLLPRAAKMRMRGQADNLTLARGLHKDNAVVALLEERLGFSNLLPPPLHGGHAHESNSVLPGRDVRNAVEACQSREIQAARGMLEWTRLTSTSGFGFCCLRSEQERQESTREVSGCAPLVCDGGPGILTHVCID